MAAVVFLVLAVIGLGFLLAHALFLLYLLAFDRQALRHYWRQP